MHFIFLEPSGQTLSTGVTMDPHRFMLTTFRILILHRLLYFFCFVLLLQKKPNNTKRWVSVCVSDGEGESFETEW